MARIVYLPQKVLDVYKNNLVEGDLLEDLIEIGRITHFYSKIGVAVIHLKGQLKISDTIVIKGSTTNLEQKIDSMEMEHKSVETAESGQSVGLKVNGKVREDDLVYKRQ
jgi:translation elongation factor EF-Tu-like GTPase